MSFFFPIDSQLQLSSCHYNRQLPALMHCHPQQLIWTWSCSTGRTAGKGSHAGPNQQAWRPPPCDWPQVCGPLIPKNACLAVLQVWASSCWVSQREERFGVLSSNEDRKTQWRRSTECHRYPEQIPGFEGTIFVLCSNKQAPCLGPDTSYAQSAINSIGPAADANWLA